MLRIRSASASSMRLPKNCTANSTNSARAPRVVSDIVIRMLNNLKAVFADRSDAVRLGMIMQLRATIPELADSEDAEIATASAIFN